MTIYIGRSSNQNFQQTLSFFEYQGIHELPATFLGDTERDRNFGEILKLLDSVLIHTAIKYLAFLTTFVLSSEW